MTEAEGVAVALPPAVLTAIATLRTAAYWLPNDERSILLDAARRAEVNWDGGCCPVCEETFCDGGCPLEEVRAGLYEGLMGDEVAQPEPKMDAEAFADVVNALGVVGRSWLDMELSIYNNPFRRNPLHQRAEPSPGCYKASWGWVHSRPSCRCRG